MRKTNRTVNITSAHKLQIGKSEYNASFLFYYVLLQVFITLSFQKRNF
jgi:hypothetical protein